jgi:hypothetical protein
MASIREYNAVIALIITNVGQGKAATKCAAVVAHNLARAATYCEVQRTRCEGAEVSNYRVRKPCREKIGYETTPGCNFDRWRLNLINAGHHTPTL